MKKNINFSIIKIILLIIIGIFAIFAPNNYINVFHVTIYCGLSIYGVIQLIISINRKTFSYFNLIYTLLSLMMIMIIIIEPILYASLLPVVLGIYILIIGLARFMSLFIYKIEPKSKLSILINALIHFSFSIVLFIRPTDNIKSCTFIMGVYLILLGLSYIPKSSRSDDNLKIVEIPMIFQSLKPYCDFLKIDFEHFNHIDNNIDIDVEILIHVRRNKRGLFGHSDLIYNNKVYSYGNYDNNTHKLKDAIGEGVLLEANKEQYINYCKSYGKFMFSFGIKLDKKEKEEMDIRFNNIMNKTYVFDKQKIVKGSYIDKLSKNVNVKFYKFKEGYYKNYFFLNYNCVKFIEEIISPNLVDFASIKTPGMLYTHLEEEYNSSNSRVIRKIIY